MIEAHLLKLRARDDALRRGGAGDPRRDRRGQRRARRQDHHPRRRRARLSACMLLDGILCRYKDLRDGTPADQRAPRRRRFRRPARLHAEASRSQHHGADPLPHRLGAARANRQRSPPSTRTSPACGGSPPTWMRRSIANGCSRSAAARRCRGLAHLFCELRVRLASSAWRTTPAMSWRSPRPTSPNASASPRSTSTAR